MVKEEIMVLQTSSSRQISILRDPMTKLVMRWLMPPMKNTSKSKEKHIL